MACGWLRVVCCVLCLACCALCGVLCVVCCVWCCVPQNTVNIAMVQCKSNAICLQLGVWSCAHKFANGCANVDNCGTHAPIHGHKKIINLSCFMCVVAFALSGMYCTTLRTPMDPEVVVE